jgi:serine/threonine protein kinase
VPHATRAGDVLADRYRLVDLLSESGGGRFWRAHDRILERHVALHVIAADDPRAELLLEAARRSATVLDPRILRVLDAERTGECCFVVNEWGSGTSLDIMLASNGPLSPRRGAWMVSEVADSIAAAHAHGVAHGLLSPENVLLDNAGSVRIIGFCVDAALHGLPPGDPQHDVVDLAGLLHATLTGRWAGVSPSDVPRAPEKHGRVLRPRQVRAGVPSGLDDLCDELLNPRGQKIRDVRDLASARGIQSFLADFVGDPTGLGPAIAAGNPEKNETGSAATAVRGATGAPAVRRGGLEAPLRAPGRRAGGGARRRVLALRPRAPDRQQCVGPRRADRHPRAGPGP